MRIRPLIAVLALSTASLGLGQPVSLPPPPSSSQQSAVPVLNTPPAWVSGEYSAVKEGIDTNVYGVEDNLAGHPPIANISSGFTTLSAGLTVNLLPPAASSDGGFLQTLSLAYAADYTAYDEIAREDNLRNTLTLQAKGREGPWSLDFENPFLYVDGSKEDPFYNLYDNLGYGPTRERRRQIQERNNSYLRYDGSGWFVRLVDSVAYYNLLIDEHDPIGAYKGYVNWVNRDNINIGPDFGYKLTGDFALVAGWRIGQQTQARPYYSLVDNDNTYNRALFGFEGRPWKWLQIQLLAGPDFRRYSDGSNSGIAGNRHTWLYTESQLTATLSSSDSLTGSNKVWHWVSSAGLSSIQETVDTLAYKHAFSKRISASAGVSLTGHRYDAPAVRNDWARSFPLDLTYALTRNLFLSADYTDTSGKTHLSPIVSPDQNFSDNLVSLSLKASF